MGRSMKARGKIARRMGVNLFAAQKYERILSRKPDPPGDRRGRRKKVSDYGMQLLEKQKLRFAYGVRERQLRRIYSDARSQGTATGVKIAELLERRLDNAVFRLGFARTRAQARQLVAHGHITVNGRTCTIPSRTLEKGDNLSVRPRKGVLSMVRSSLSQGAVAPSWLERDTETGESPRGRLIALPQAADLEVPVELQRVVEFYAR